MKFLNNTFDFNKTQPPEIEEGKKQAMLKTTLMAGTLPIFGCGFYLANSNYFALGLMVSGTILSGLLHLALRFHKISARITIYGMMIIWTLVFCILPYTIGGMNSLTTAWTIVPAATLFVFAGSWFGIMSGFAALINIVLIGAIQSKYDVSFMTFNIAKDIKSDLILFNTFNLILFAIFIFLILNVFSSGVYQVSAELAKTSDALKVKHSELKSLLDSIPQGILQIGRNAKVLAGYSEFFSQIYDANDIVGNEAIELIFSNSDINGDAMHQIRSVIEATIDGHPINLTLNEHILPRNIVRNEKQYLSLDWGIVETPNGLVGKILLMVKDESKLRNLEIENKKKTAEDQMLLEMLKIEPKFLNKHLQALSYLVKKSTQAAESSDPTKTSSIMRDVHTIKGNSRMLGLSIVADLCHQIESDICRHMINPSEIDLAELIKRIECTVDSYTKIFENKLNTKKSETSLVIEKSLLHRINAHLTSTRAPKDLLEEIDLYLKNRLDRLLTTSISNLEGTSKKLGKETPRVHFLGDSLETPEHIDFCLIGVFAHLFRNSLDHGIEDAKTRTMAAKPAKGNIFVEVRHLDDGFLFIRYWDDGAGLNLAKIRSKIASNDPSSVTDEQCAREIFRPAFSTKDQVSDISGRGVGMDAVKDSIESLNGKIELKFTQEGTEFRPFCFEITIPITSSAPRGL